MLRLHISEGEVVTVKSFGQSITWFVPIFIKDLEIPMCLIISIWKLWHKKQLSLNFGVHLIETQLMLILCCIYVL